MLKIVVSLLVIALAHFAACQSVGLSCTGGTQNACPNGLVCISPAGLAGGKGTCQTTATISTVGQSCIGGTQNACSAGSGLVCVSPPGVDGGKGTCQLPATANAVGQPCTAGTLNACPVGSGLVCVSPPGLSGGKGTCQLPSAPIAGEPCALSSYPSLSQKCATNLVCIPTGPSSKKSTPGVCKIPQSCSSSSKCPLGYSCDKSGNCVHTPCVPILGTTKSYDCPNLNFDCDYIGTNTNGRSVSVCVRPICTSQAQCPFGFICTSQSSNGGSTKYCWSAATHLGLN